MQLIAMAMPKGDKGKQKNRNRHQPRSSDGSADNQSSLANQGPGVSFPHENGNNLHVIDLPLSISIDLEEQKVFSVICPLEEVGHLSISPSDIRSLAQHCSASSQSGSVPESVFSGPYQQDTVNKNSGGQVARVGDEWVFANVFEKNDHRSGGEMSEEAIDSESVREQGDDGLPSHPGSHRSSLSNKTESIESDRDLLEVDENMNLTGTYSSYLTKSLPSVYWSKSVVNTEMPNSFKSVSGTMDIANTEKENVGEGYISNIPNSVDSSIGSQACRWSEIEDGILPQESISDFTNCNSSDILHRANVQGQATTPIIRQLNYFNTRTLFEPPLWTSLAHREHATNCQHAVDVPGLNISNHIEANYFTNQPLTFSYMPDNKCMSHTGVSESEVSAIGEGDIPDHYVFQNCLSNGAANIISPSMYGYNNVQSEENTEVNNGDDEERDSYCSNNSFSVTLGDLDDILRMLPSTHVERDILFNQMADEEVAMVMYQEENNDVDEELVSFDMVDDYVHVLRPGNPVAFILEHGGHEHFLPIADEASEEIKRL